jgi:hypothetical protein
MQTIHELAKDNRLRTGWEESRVGLEKDPWLMIIPGRNGHVYQHAPGQPAFATNTRNRGRSMVREITGCVVLQNGDDGINATFPVEALPLVAKRLRLYKKPQLTPEHVALLKERMARINAKPKGMNSLRGQTATQIPQDDLGVEQP